MNHRITNCIAGLAFAAFALGACGGGPAPAPTKAPPTATKAPRGDAAKGKDAFLTCSACHGLDGKGVPNLGKDMTTSTFIKGLNDDQMVDFMKKGRPASDPLNTTKVDMPPKGGNPALTDQQLYDIVAYIRSLTK